MDGLNLGNIPLGDHDADWIRVITAATNQSLRVQVASICSGFVQERKSEYEAIVDYLARKYGHSFDECFHRLRTGQDLGEPLSYYPLNASMEEAISSLSTPVEGEAAEVAESAQFGEGEPED